MNLYQLRQPDAGETLLEELGDCYGQEARFLIVRTTRETRGGQSMHLLEVIKGTAKQGAPNSILVPDQYVVLNVTSAA